MNLRPDYTSIIENADRLKKDYQTHGNLCIAFDYDNTLFDYHGDNPKNLKDCIDLMLRCQKVGLDLVLWTCSEPSRYPSIRTYLATFGITDFMINDVPDKYMLLNSRKIFFSLLLDDRAGLGSAMRTLSILLNSIE